MFNQFKKNLDHIWIAYKYFLSAIPQDSLFVNDKRVAIGNVVFEKPSQAHSMEIELGWAFYRSMEACLEVFLKKTELKAEKVDEKILLKKGVWNQFTTDEQEGIKIYREIRNALLHSEGNTELLYKKHKPYVLKLDEDRELHLKFEQMEKFRNLFIKVAKMLCADEKSVIS